jgi:hypothetical protein
MNSEPKLCPYCPARGWIPDVTKRLKKKEIIKTNEKPSTLKTCMELRKIIKDLDLPPCPHYPENENLTVHLKTLK